MTVLAIFCLVSNFASSIKAIRKASVYLMEEPLFYHYVMFFRKQDKSFS